MQTKSRENVLPVALKGIAVAMAVAVIVLGILGTATVPALVTLLAVGLGALALNALRFS